MAPVPAHRRRRSKRPAHYSSRDCPRSGYKKTVSCDGTRGPSGVSCGSRRWQWQWQWQWQWHNMSGGEQPATHARGTCALCVSLPYFSCAKLPSRFFGPRGARRSPAGRFAQNAAGGHGFCGTLARSCAERSCATTTTKNVPPSVDEMTASSRPSRWTPRRRRGPSATRRAGPRVTSGGVKGCCHVVGWDRKKGRCTVS